VPADINPSTLIADVFIVDLPSYADDRGVFAETFRRSWFPQRSWENLQTNRSLSRPGVIRGLHYHFRQVDYWCVMSGRIRAVLLDIRPDSPTFGASQGVDMGDDQLRGLYIPAGVAHGFAALTPVVLTYIVDNYYDSNDEYGVAWNDPLVTVDWGVADPILSDRDLANPPLAEIAAALRPRRTAA
jgi:dTDP-4-dehydrorhamnose 3,5-epimerase